MQQVISKITENMQLIYRKAIDADSALEALQKTGKGKFSVIFAKDSGFKSRSKRFGPYVEELAMDITMLQEKESDVEKAIVDIVKKMELMLITLAQFKETL